MDNDLDDSDLAARLEKALNHRLPENTGQRRAIRTILNRSVEYGRAARVMGDDPDDDACGEYVDQVITCHEKFHKLLTCLEANDPEAWAILIRKIEYWATKYFKKHNIFGPLQAQCLNECVPNAVLAFLSSAYHYDSDFDAWFCVLVQNVCKRYIRDERRAAYAGPEKTLSLEEFTSLFEAPADNNEIDARRLLEMRQNLLEAVEKLSSEARKELIILHYFMDYSFKEIAGRMHRTLNATYKLHFDALNELRDNLGPHL
jgi:RNA polymerase sigma factor (sigma-70 family)